MAISKCGSCGKNIFEIVEKEPNGANFKQMFVQCAICGVPIGVTNFTNVNTQIKNLDKRLQELESALGTIDHNLRILISQLSR